MSQVAALIKSLRDEHAYPIFLNADHTHSIERVEEAVRAGYDAVLFDGSQLSFEENIEKTKEADVVRKLRKIVTGLTTKNILQSYHNAVSKKE